MPLLTAAALAAMTLAPSPIRLIANEEGAATRFEVVGESAVPLTARYELEIQGGTGNRNRNSGTATLRPGERHVFATVRVSGERYQARLRVLDSEGRQLSEQVVRSED